MSKNILSTLIIGYIIFFNFNCFYTIEQDISQNEIPSQNNAIFKYIKFVDGRTIVFNENGGNLTKIDSNNIIQHHVTGISIENKYIDVDIHEIRMASIETREVIPYITPIYLLGIPVFLVTCALLWMIIHPPR
jgi:hypothetical protein